MQEDALQDSADIEKIREIAYMYEASEDPDFIRCLQYIQLYEIRVGLTKKDVADYFGIHVNTLDQWRARWSNNGLLSRCRRVLVIPMTEDIRVSEIQALLQWPQILARQVKTAISAKSDKTALEAAMWLREVIIQPHLDEQNEAGIDEIDYVKSIAERVKPFDPLTIGDTQAPDSDSNQ